MKSPIPIRRYLSLQFSIVAALPVIIIAFLVWLFLMPTLQKNTGIQHQGMARSIAGQISAHLMGGQRQLTALANFIETQERRPARQLFSLLDSQCGKGELFETIYISTNEDVSISSVGLAYSSRYKREDLLGLNLSGRSFIQRVRRVKRAVWSETFLSTASSRLAVALTIPLADSLITGEITLDNLSEFISHLPVEAGFLTYVIDRQGRVVADSQRRHSGQQLNVATLPTNKHEGDKQFASSSFELDGRPFLGTVVDIHQLGWKVLIAQSTQQAYRPMRATFITIAFGLAIALVLAVSISWLLSGDLSRLSQSYAEKAQSIAHGQYDIQWPPARTLEYNHLGQSLQQMAQMISQREKALIDSESHLSITLNSIGDAVIATDNQGLITRMNPLAVNLTGWKEDSAVGKHLTEVFRIVNAYTRQTVTDPVEKVLAKGEIVGLANHTILIARNGNEYQIADSGAPICHEDGRIVGVVLVFRDVTEKMHMEEMMIQSEKMLSVGGLAAGMAHEINNPLAGMMQTANVMTGRLTNLILPANRKAAQEAGTTMEAIESFMEARGIPRMIDTINVSGKRVAAVVDNMLSFARKSEATVSSHDLEVLIDKSLELAATDYDLKKHYDFKRIRIDREYADKLPVVPCEGAKIQQVLLNIFRNGAQAMQAAGSEFPRFVVRTWFEKKTQMVCMEIEDNGPGMDETTRKRVFEPFFTTKPTGVGTGLGLSVSYFIITENHGGTIAVESLPGSGTKFIVRLPAKRE
jgi:PAS domain S-box-containing protein